MPISRGPEIGFASPNLTLEKLRLPISQFSLLPGRLKGATIIEREAVAMVVKVTLSLPESLIEHAKRFSQATQQNVEVVLADALEMMWPTLEGMPDTRLYPPVSSLSDDQVLELANSKMDEAQNQRLGHLQAKGKVEGLNEAERYELLALMQIYQLGQLRKSEAIAEAVQRGLRLPLSS
jgi:hypothetical protein